MSAAAGPLLILGVGNVLLRDEGVGIHLARELERDGPALPPGTEVVDGGTLGVELLGLVADARALLLLDAADLHAPPGSIRILRGQAVQGMFGGHLSPHQAGPGDLLAAAALTGALPSAVAMVGIQPGEVDYGLTLSPEVESALQLGVTAAGAVAWELEEMVQHA